MSRNARGCLLPAAVVVAVEMVVLVAAFYLPPWALALASVALALLIAWGAGAQPLPRVVGGVV